jgi:hypothetical protein
MENQLENLLLSPTLTDVREHNHENFSSIENSSRYKQRDGAMLSSRNNDPLTTQRGRSQDPQHRNWNTTTTGCPMAKTSLPTRARL